MNEQEYFIAALQLKTQSERVAYLDKKCAPGSPERRRVEELLEEHDKLGDFLEVPVIEKVLKSEESELSTPRQHGVESLLAAGTILDDFRIVREIGQGGMGIVFEAEQISLQRRVALKILPFASVLDRRQLQRFKNEAMAAAGLDHPHIVHVYGFGCQRGVHYYAMQFVEGQDLAKLNRDIRNRNSSDALCLAESAMPNVADAEAETVPVAGLSTKVGRRRPDFFRTIAAWGATAAEAIGFAHDHGVLHRDVKPSNLLLDSDGKLWITDFGLARIEGNAGLTLTGDFMGTLRYMSPEQALGRRGVVDHRSDIYALGATLYELATGEPMFGEPDRGLLLKQIAEEEPALPRSKDASIPLDLETIILKAVSKDAADRYPTAHAVAADLKRFLQNEPIAAKRPGWTERFTKWVRRHRAIAGSVAGLGLTVLAAALVVALLLLKHNDTLGEMNSQLDAANKELNSANADLQQVLQDRKKGELDLRRSRRRALDVQYALRIRLASQSETTQDPRQLVELLNSCRPHEGEDDCRGFEWYYLRGLVEIGHEHRLISDSGLQAVAYSGDGRWQAVANEGGDVTFTSPTTAAPVTSVHVDGGDLYDIAFSPDSRRLAVASGHDINILDVDKFNITRRLHCPANVFHLRFHPTKNILISVGDEPIVRGWDLDNDSPSIELKGHQAPVEGIAISQDGKYLATGGNDQAVKVWSLDDWRMLGSKDGFGDRFTAVAFLDDGSTFAAGNVAGEIWLFDRTSLTFRLLGKHYDAITDIAWDGTGQRLFTSDRGGVICSWAITDSPEPQLPLPVHAYRAARRKDEVEISYTWAAHSQRIRGLAISPRINQLASVADDGELCLWPTQLPATSRSFAVPEKEGPEFLHFAMVPGTDSVACINYDSVRIVDLPSLAVKAEHYVGFAMGGEDVAVSPDGTTIAICRQVGRVEFWDADFVDLRRVLTFPDDFAEARAIFSPDGTMLLLHDPHTELDDELRLYDVQTLTRMNQLHNVRAGGICFAPFGAELAFGEEDSDDVVIWDLKEKRERLRLAGHSSTVDAVQYSYDGTLLATGSHDRSVVVWDVATGRMLHKLNGHHAKVSAIAFSPDDRSLITGDQAGAVKVWQVATGSWLMDLPKMTQPVLELGFSGDGRYFARLYHRTALIIDEIPVSESQSENTANGGPLNEEAGDPSGVAEAIRLQPKHNQHAR